MSGGDVRIVVDADACPVKREIADTARQFGVPVMLVASYDHALVPEPGVEVRHVERGRDAVDLYISNLIRPGDIVVTQDFGLAAMALAKRATVLSNRGQRYRNETIDFLMESRHDQAKARRAGGRTKGPRAMTREDRIRFQQMLTKVLRDMQDNGDR